MRTKVTTEVSDDELKGGFGPGKESLKPFMNDYGVDDFGFDFGNIFSGPHLTIVPEDPNGVDPRCPKCRGDVSGEVCKLCRPDDETYVTDIDFTGAKVSCPNCGGVFRLDELGDGLGTGIFLTTRYVSFVDEAGRVKPEWLAEFDAAVGTRHRFVSYGYS